MQTFNEDTHSYIHQRMGLNANQMTIDQGRSVINQLVQDLQLSQRQLFTTTKQLNELKRKVTILEQQLNNVTKSDKNKSMEYLTKESNKVFLTYIINVRKELDSLRGVDDFEFFSKVLGRISVLTTDIKKTIQKLSDDAKVHNSVITYSNKEQELLFKVEEFVNDKNSVFKVESYTGSILTIIEELLSIDSTVEVKSTTKKKVDEQQKQPVQDEKKECDCFMHRLKRLPEDKTVLFYNILNERTKKLNTHFIAFISEKETKEQFQERLSFDVFSSLIFYTLQMMYYQRIVMVDSSNKDAQSKFEATKDYVVKIQNDVIEKLSN